MAFVNKSSTVNPIQNLLELVPSPLWIATEAQQSQTHCSLLLAFGREVLAFHARVGSVFRGIFVTITDLLLVGSVIGLVGHGGRQSLAWPCGVFMRTRHDTRRLRFLVLGCQLAGCRVSGMLTRWVGCSGTFVVFG